jgi:rare lipoprotein A
MSAPASALSAGWRLLTSAALASVALVSGGIVDEAGAKGPGARYCFYGTCHKVKTIAETEAMVGKEMRLAASFYDSCKTDRYNPCGLTSSGEVFHPHTADNAASPDLPDGTVLLVRNPANGQAAVVRVNNAGPYWGNRKLDLSRAAAEKLGFVHRGVAQLEVRVIKAPTAAEARYKKHRRYDPVPGYIGRFASSDKAHLTVAMAMELKVPARIRVASLDGGVALPTGEGGDRHGLRAALKSRVARLPQQAARLAAPPQSEPAVAVVWQEAPSPTPRRQSVVAREATMEREVAAAAMPAALDEVRAEPVPTPVLVLASAPSPEPPMQSGVTEIVHADASAVAITASDVDDLKAFALFVPERQPQTKLAEVSRQVAGWTRIEPTPSCDALAAPGAGHLVAFAGPPPRARVPDLLELRA